MNSNYRGSISAVPKPGDAPANRIPDIPKVEHLNTQSTQQTAKTEEKENITVRLNDYEKGVKKIFEATGIADANEII